MEAATVTAAERQQELRPAVEAWVEQVGGWSLIRMRDIERILMQRHPDLWSNIVSADQSMSIFLGRQVSGKGNMANVGHETLDAIQALTTEINEAADPRAHFFSLLREASGLIDTPVMSETGWPFRVELIPMEKLYADDSYQRPLDDAFVRKTVLAFDESLVGVIDVADTGDGRYAIMDGRQRHGASAVRGKTALWSAIYEGLDVSEQARFFHHKNRDRKNVHPYYHFRARAVAGDTDAQAITEIVEGRGYRMGIGAADPATITAIRAVEQVFSMSSEHRDNALDPTLAALFRMWYDVKGGKDGTLIRGLGRFFAVYSDDEIHWPHLEDHLAAVGPTILQGRARDLIRRADSAGGTHSIGLAIARAIVTFHNTGLARTDRLNPDRL